MDSLAHQLQFLFIVKEQQRMKVACEKYAAQDFTVGINELSDKKKNYHPQHVQ